MFKALLSALLALTLIGCSAAPKPVVAPTQPAVSLEDTVAKSMWRITGVVMTFMGPGHYTCSGFQIAPKRVQTAAHCVGEDMKADGIPVKVLKVDEYYDLALLEVEKDKPALEFRSYEALKGEQLLAIGYGYGWPFLTALDQEVLVVNAVPDVEFPPMIFVYPGYIGGMSGGPVVDMDGKVVSVIQMSGDKVGLGVGVTIIKAFLLGT